MSTLDFENVTVAFGRGSSAMHAVDHVDLHVGEGQIIGLVGESGSGKSSLARAAVGLAPLSGGRILLNGQDVPIKGRNRPVQMVFQDPVASLDPRMNIGASIAEAMTGVRSRAVRRSETERLLAQVHLDPAVINRPPSTLSGGQRQRVALARALAANPQVVIADEITSALDVSVQGAMLNLVRDVQKSTGLSMLFISHNLAVVRYVSDVIAVMYLGRIVEIAPTEQLLADPQHPYTRTLLATVPQLGVALPPAPGDAGELFDTWSATAEGSTESRAGTGDRAGVTPDAVDGAELADVEPADPHAPPPGCRFHPRCPVGPLARPERDICVLDDPQVGAPERPHRTACHFPGTDPSDPVMLGSATRRPTSHAPDTPEAAAR
jgi:peptide/nickel transport system ATP-binding protein